MSLGPLVVRQLALLMTCDFAIFFWQYMVYRVYSQPNYTWKWQKYWEHTGMYRIVLKYQVFWPDPVILAIYNIFELLQIARNLSQILFCLSKFVQTVYYICLNIMLKIRVYSCPCVRLFLHNFYIRNNVSCWYCRWLRRWFFFFYQRRAIKLCQGNMPLTNALVFLFKMLTRSKDWTVIMRLIMILCYKSDSATQFTLCLTRISVNLNLYNSKFIRWFLLQTDYNTYEMNSNNFN